MPPAQQRLALRQHQHGDKAVVAGAALDFLEREIRRLHRHHDGGAQPRILRQPFGRDPVVDRLAEAGRHIGIEHRLRAVDDIADRVADAPSWSNAPRCTMARSLPGLLPSVGPPVGAAAKRHVRRIGIEVEAVDGAAHHLLFPVIVEIGQQRRARSAHRRVDVAVDPRGRHGVPSDVVFGGALRRNSECAADGREVQGWTTRRRVLSGMRKTQILALNADVIRRDQRKGRKPWRRKPGNTTGHEPPPISGRHGARRHGRDDRQYLALVRQWRRHSAGPCASRPPPRPPRRRDRNI